MSVIIRLQNLPLHASSMDIRSFFHGLSIPDGGVHIVGGRDGDAFIAFSSDEDARQAMNLSGGTIKDEPIKLLLSSRNEMFKIIEESRQLTMGHAPNSPPHTRVSNSGALGRLETNSAGIIHAQNGQNQQNSLNGTLQPGPDLSSASLGGNPNFALAGLGVYPGFNMNMGMLGDPNTGAAGNIPGFPNVKIPQQTQQQQQQQQQQLNALATAGVTGTTGLQGMNMNPYNPFALAGMTPNQMQMFPAAMMHAMMPQGLLPNVFPQASTTGLVQGTNAQQQLLQNAASLPGPFGAGTQIGVNRPMGLNLNPMVAAGGTGPGNLLGSHSIPTSLHNGSEVSSSSSSVTSRPSRFSSLPVSSQQQQKPQLDPFGRGINSNISKPPGRSNADFDTRGVGGSPSRKPRSGSPGSRDSRDNERRRRSRSREKRDSRFSNRSRSRSGSRSKTNRGNNHRHQSPPSSSHRDNKFPHKNPFHPNPTSTTTSSSSSSKRTDRGLRDERKVSSGAESNNDLIIDERLPIAEFPVVQLIGVPNDASFRDIRQFIHEEIHGGYEGVVRDYTAGIAFVRLEKSSDFGKIIRKSGKWNICGSVIRVEGVSLEKWETEYKRHKSDKLRYESEESNNVERRRPDRNSNSGSSVGVSGPGPCTLVIKGLPVHYSGQDIFKITLNGVNDSLFSDIHVHEESRDINGIQTATAYVKFFNRPDAERACEIVSRNHGPHLKVRVGDMDELVKVRDQGGARPDTSAAAGVLAGAVPSSSLHQSHHPRTHNTQFNGPGPAFSNNDVKPLLELDVGNLEAESSTILMKGLPYKIQDRDIFDFFSDLGLTPTGVKIVQDAQGTRNGQVVVDFQNHSHATRACTKNGMVFGRFPITVTILPRGARPGIVLPRPGSSSSDAGGVGGGPPGNFPNPRFPSPRDENPFEQALRNVAGPMPRGPPPMGRGRGGPRGGMRGGRGGGGPRPSRFNSLDSIGGEKDNRSRGAFERPGCVLAVTNIPFSASMDDILQFFEEILNKPISRANIIRRYNEYQKPTGDARIAFNSTYEASEALSLLQGATLWNRPLTVTILSEDLMGGGNGNGHISS